MQPLPVVLRGIPFTTAQARAAGLSGQVLRGRRFRRLFRDVYTTADADPTPLLWIKAALLALPPDAVASHTTALQLRGVQVGPTWPLHFSTNSSSQTTLDGVLLHRRQRRLWSEPVQTVPTVGPDRALVDSATELGFVALVTAVDWLAHTGQTSLETLTKYAYGRRLHGVRRIRRLLPYARERVESPMETLIRLMLLFARLPEPAVNVNIVDRHGHFIARGDLVYALFRVVVEYDGIHHEREPRQRQRDRQRREALEAEGWRVIVITSADLIRPQHIPWRVYAALEAHGYRGPRPHLNEMWYGWFESRQTIL